MENGGKDLKLPFVAAGFAGQGTVPEAGGSRGSFAAFGIARVRR